MNIIQLTDDELDAKLKSLFSLHQGRQNAIERWALVLKIFGEGSDIPRTDDNLHDRAVRAAVQRLRSHGMFILDMNDGKGRFLAHSSKEYLDFRSSYLKPLRSRADVIRAMDKFAEQTWPNLLQPTLFDLDEFTRVLE